MDDLGAGLAALAFWGFIASMVVAGIWDGARKREAQHETLRRMIETGKPVDDALMRKLMVGEPKQTDRDLAISAIIVFAVAVGLALLAVALRGPGAEAVRPLLGAAGLVACIAIGLLVASVYTKRARIQDGPRMHVE